MPTSQTQPQRRSARLQSYDYSQSGFYFVTICTQDQKCMFGEIVNGEMYLNGAGSIAQSIWSTLPERFPHVELDQYVVMPNHVHGIVVLAGSTSMPREDIYSAKVPERFMHAKGIVYQDHTTNMALQHGRINQVHTGDAVNRVPADALNRVPPLGEIIRTFKGAATYRIRSEGKRDFAWLGRYYEHIIRNDDDLDRIRQYIVNNPAHWTEDRLYMGA